MNRNSLIIVLTLLGKNSSGQLKNHHRQNILVINLKYLGDLVVSTTAIRALRKSYPDSRISFLVRNEYKNVLLGNPNLDEIIPFDTSIKRLPGLKQILAELKFIRLLRSKKYDAVISLQAGDRYAIWSFLSGAEVRVAPIQNNLGFLLTDKAKVLEDKIDYMNYYLRIVEKFGAVRNGLATEFYLDQKYESWAGEILKEKIGENDILIGIHPGASEPTKIWPLEKFQEVILQLVSYPNIKIVLFLGPAEQKMKFMIGGLHENVFVSDTSESIQQLAWLINSCSLVLCNDSGARHLSAALKIPTITLFPEDKILPWKFYPEEEKQYFIIGKRNTNSYKKSFLDGIEVDEVVEKIKEILNLNDL